MAAAPAPANSKRNLWAVSLGSFWTDVSSEMVLNLLPLYLSSVLGVKANVIGLIEGVAEATASWLRLVSGRLSDHWGSRKGLAVFGYGISAAAKPFFYLVTSWGGVAAVRWADRVGKGVRTAPRDALLAASTAAGERGFAFGFHRAADTLGAVVGLGVALVVVLLVQGHGGGLTRETWKLVVLASLPPALLGVLALAIFAREVPAVRPAARRKLFDFRGLGRPFYRFLLVAALFDLGNSADAFLVLRAAERGVGTAGVLAMLLLSNLVYALAATPCGRVSDRVGRRPLLAAGWLLYAAVYLGFALARTPLHLGLLWALYGLYYALSFGTMKAMVADLVPDERRGTAYGTLAATLGLVDLPASALAGLLWHGAGPWQGFGPAAPFTFGATLAALAAALLLSRFGTGPRGEAQPG